MDGTSIPEQHTILVRIASFLRTFENAGSKSTLPPASPTLLGTAMSTSSHPYRGVTGSDAIGLDLFWFGLDEPKSKADPVYPT